MNRGLIALLFLIEGVSLVGAMTDPPRPSLVLTARENGTQPQAELLCHGKIHGYVRLPAAQQGSHRLASRWTLPNGKVAADSENMVDFPPPGRSTAYVWFAFPETRSALGALDPQADAARLTYPGQWTVDVRWDDAPLLRQTFQVTCP